jgi:hypothetical protein
LYGVLNGTVRGGVPRLVWQTGSRESITPVNVTKAVLTRVIRESLGQRAQRQLPGLIPGGGRM